MKTKQNWMRLWALGLGVWAVLAAAWADSSGGPYYPNGGTGTGGVSTNQAFHPAQFGNLAFWFSARQLAGYTNGQPVNKFTDLSGRGNDFNGTNMSYVGQVGNGEGGIYFGQQFYPVACMASNSTILASNPGLNTNCTIVLVYQSDQRNINQPAPQGGQFFNSSPRGATGFGLLDNDATGTGLDMNVATNQSTFNLSKNYDGKPVILTIRFTGGLLDTWMNGVPQIQQQGTYGGLGLAGNLYLGDFHNTGWYTWNGSISEILIYTNALTNPQVQAVNAYYAQAMEVNALDVIFLGDSITTGIQTTNGALWKDFVLASFPQAQVQNENLPGLTTGTMLTNTMNHIGSFRSRPGYRIVHLYGGVNDNANGLAVTVTETNILNLNAMLRTNGFTLVPGTLISQSAIDGNGYKTNLNNWLVANSNLFGALIRYDLITALGTNGACSNSVYFAGDYTHPKAGAYNLMSNSCVSGIQYAWNQLIGNAPLVNGAGLTNLPAGQLTGLVPTNSLSTNTAPRAGSIYGRSGDNLTSQWMQHDIWDGTNHILEYQTPYGITNQLTSTNGAAQVITWWQGGSNVLSFPTNTTQPLWNGVALTGNNGGSLTNLPATNLVGVLPQASIPYAAPLGIYFSSPYTNNLSYYVPPPYSGAASSTIGSYQCFCPAGFSGHITNCIILQTVNNLGVGTNISVWAFNGALQGTLLGTLNGAAVANQITNCPCNYYIANPTNVWCIGLSNNTPSGFGPSLHASAYLQTSP